jgi:hypothetical protein
MHQNLILKLTIHYLIFLFILGCTKKNGNTTEAENGYATGKATDTYGQPLSNVRIIIDNTLVFNSNIQTTTNSSGNYKAKLTVGSWMPYAQLSKVYNGKNYLLYLDPSSNLGFGIEGGICDFQWKLTGPKKLPLTGNYGGTILLTKAVGSILFDAENIEYTLTPIGSLIDGSPGNILKRKKDADYPRMTDLPIGRYSITAFYNGPAGSFPIKLKNRYTNEGFASSIVIDFEPMSIDGDIMASIEYSEN